MYDLRKILCYYYFIMNMNDMRANAYSRQGNEKKPGNNKKSANGTDKGNVKAFVPPRITKVVSEKSEKPAEPEIRRKEPEKEQIHSNRPLFSEVNKEVGKILETQTTDYLKSGGLVKVPVAPAQEDGKDSVYRRVAKFLLLIGIDEAAKILPHLSQEQTERIIPEIASIRNVDQDEAIVIMEEFRGLLEKSRESGGVDKAREILVKAYGPEKAQALIDKAAPFKGARPFDYLNDADSERLLFLLSDESEQIQALVLSNLEPKKAASVINLMAPDRKTEVVKRLAKMEPISPEVLRRVDQAMHEKSLAQTSEKAENIDGRNALAAILKKMSPEAEDGILSNLAEEDPELGEDLRSRLFTMEDVINGDDKFIQEKLRDMTEPEIAMLLARKSDGFCEKILSCISAGRRQLVREEQEINAPYRKADCERVTAQFFSILRRAYESGELIIKGRNEEEYV